MRARREARSAQRAATAAAKPAPSAAPAPAEAQVRARKEVSAAQQYAAPAAALIANTYAHSESDCYPATDADTAADPTTDTAADPTTDTAADPATYADARADRTHHADVPGSGAAADALRHSTPGHPDAAVERWHRGQDRSRRGSATADSSYGEFVHFREHPLIRPGRLSGFVR